MNKKQEPQTDENLAIKLIISGNHTVVKVYENFPIQNWCWDTMRKKEEENQKIYQASLILEDTVNITARHYSDAKNLNMLMETLNKTLPPFSKALFVSQNAPKEKGKYTKWNYKKRISQRSTVIYDVVNNNFLSKECKMLTLAFDDLLKPKDLKYALHQFQKFIIRLKRIYTGLKYIATYARQTCGNWHFHMICNIKSINNQELKNIWGNGSVRISNQTKCKSIYSLCNYLIKNMKQNSEELMNTKGYLVSQKVNRSKVLRSWNEAEADECLEIFDKLRNEPKGKLFQAKHSVGAIIQVKYPDETVEKFLQNYEIRERKYLTVIEEIYSTISTVKVYLDSTNKMNPYMLAMKKPKK